MRSALVLLILAAAARVAAADEAPIALTPATAAEEIFVLKQQKLDNGAKVVVRETVHGQGAGADVRAVIFDGQQWWSPADGPHLASECGAGHCTDVTLSSVSLTAEKGVVWIRYELKRSVTFSDRENAKLNHASAYTAVQVCKLAAAPASSGAPSCGFLDDNATKVTIKGNDVTYSVTSDDGKTTTPHTRHFAL